MRLSHADFRPGKRPRFVPSGSPRRKFPLIRLVVLIGLGTLIYTRFDDLWHGVKQVVEPMMIWQKNAGDENANGNGMPLIWNQDSSRVTLNCPRGLTRECCESLGRADDDLCGASSALLEKARWKGVLSRGTDAAKPQPLQLEARAVVSDLGDWGYELSGLRGRDAAGTYTFRRTSGSQVWCDARRGCLKAPLARAPLTDGRLVSESGGEPVRDGATVVRWVSASSRVRAVLPGRIIGINSASRTGGADSASVSVRVYHGGELYATYGPLQAAQGVKAGVLVKSGSYLGDARAEAAGTGDYALTVALRQGGQPVDAAAFWGLSLYPDPGATMVSSVSGQIGDGLEGAGRP